MKALPPKSPFLSLDFYAVIVCFSTALVRSLSLSCATLYQNKVAKENVAACLPKAWKHHKSKYTNSSASLLSALNTLWVEKNRHWKKPYSSTLVCLCQTPTTSALRPTSPSINSDKLLFLRIKQGIFQQIATFGYEA